MALPLHNLLQYNHESLNARLVILFPGPQILLDKLIFLNSTRSNRLPFPQNLLFPTVGKRTTTKCSFRKSQMVGDLFWISNAFVAILKRDVSSIGTE